MISQSINISRPIPTLPQMAGHPSFVDFQTQVSYYQQQLSQALQINTILTMKLNQLSNEHSPPAFLLTHSQKSQNSLTTSNNDVKIQESYSEEEFMCKIEHNDQQPSPKRSHKIQDQNSQKNQTKNIPKNYGKAMLSFIQKNYSKYFSIIKPILKQNSLSIVDLLKHIKIHKKQVNSIHYLKQMWGHKDQANPIKKCIRILSFVFMRKYCLSYIFNSRVKNYYTHVKYRQRIIEGINNPAEFNCIKQF